MAAKKAPAKLKRKPANSTDSILHALAQITDDDLGFDDDEDDDDATDEESGLSGFWAGLDSETQIYLQRFEPNGKRSQCGRYPWDLMADDPIEFVRREWGPGRYLMIKVRPGKGGLRGKKSLTIAAKPVSNGLVSPQQTNGAVTSVHDVQIQMLRDELQNHRNMVNTLLMQRNGSGNEGTAIVAALAPLFRPPDMVGQFSAMMTAVNSSRPAAEDPIVKAKELLELTRSIAGSNAPGMTGDPKVDGWLSVAERVIDRLPTGFLQPKPAPAALPAGATPANTTTPAAPQAAAETSEQVEQRFIAELTAGIETLRKRFSQNRDPKEMALTVWQEHRESPHYNAVVSSIAGGARVDQLFVFAPVLAENEAEKTWFETVFVTLKAEYEKNPTPAA